MDIIDRRSILNIVLLHPIHINYSNYIRFLRTFTKFLKPLQIILNRYVGHILRIKTCIDHIIILLN
jgi:hypothetical protein